MKSIHFLVTWEIDIYAESAQEAAEIARDIQTDKSNEATVFEVKNSKTGEVETVDLIEYGED